MQFKKKKETNSKLNEKYCEKQIVGKFRSLLQKRNKMVRIYLYENINERVFQKCFCSNLFRVKTV